MEANTITPATLNVIKVRTAIGDDEANELLDSGWRLLSVIAYQQPDIKRVGNVTMQKHSNTIYVLGLEADTT
jgi:hypothetical protein